eukprot:COSAG02_NODE_76098_length_138_cov_14.974359_1_plen_20_part_01
MPTGSQQVVRKVGLRVLIGR